MSGLSDIVSVAITANTRTPSRAGFGTLLCVGYDSGLTAGETTVVERLTDLTDAGASADGSLYKMVQAAFSQNPRPPSVKVLSLSSGLQQSWDLTMTTSTEDDVVSCTVVAPDGTETEISYTVGSGETTTDVATAVAALIDAISGIASTSASAVVSADPDTAGDVWSIKDAVNMDVELASGDGGYDTALTAIESVDNDWYAVAIDQPSEVNVDDVAAWVETRTKLFVASTPDSGELDGAGTIASGLKSLGYDRTAVLFSEDIHSYAGAAWLGRMLPTDPGSATWAFKELKGVVASDLTPTEETQLESENCNHYQTVGGLDVTQKGLAASGEFLDVTRGIDWLTARLQERIFGLLANADKIPFTDTSVDLIKSEILAQLEIAVTRGLLRPNTLSVTAPEVADVSAADRAARTLPDVEFGAELAGAIHKVEIQGTVTV